MVLPFGHSPASPPILVPNAVSITSCSGQICQLPCSRDSLMTAETAQLLWLQMLLCIHTSTIFFFPIFLYVRTVFASSHWNPMQYYKKSHYLFDGFQKCLPLLFQRWLPSLPTLLYYSDDFSFFPSSAADWKGYPRVGYILIRKVKMSTFRNVRAATESMMI